MRRQILAAGVALLAAGCAPPMTPGIAAHSALLPLAAAPCPVDGSGSGFSDEVQSLKLTVNAKDMTTPVKTTGDVGALTITDVPAGKDRLVGLFGLTGATTTWRGVAQHVSLDPNEQKNVDVLMTRLADITCGRGADIDKRAFATATVLDDGTILVVGGANSGGDASATCGAGCHGLEATTSASIFDPSDGTFSAVGQMGTARMFHVAVKLKDGRVVIAGGAGAAKVFPAGDTSAPFPIVPSQPVSEVELFDPATKTFSDLGADPGGPRVFAAGAQTDDGEAVITGGIPAALTPINDLSNALDTTTICDGSGCRTGPLMQARRAGHTAFRVSSQHVNGVVLWGGGIVDGTHPDAFQLELLQGGQTWSKLNVSAMTASRNRFFAACTDYLPFRTLCAGGLVRGDDGSFTPSTSAEVYSAIDNPNGGTDGGIATGGNNGDVAMALSSPRFFASAAALPGGSRAIVAGGFTDLAFSPSPDLELFDQKLLVQAAPGKSALIPVGVGGVPRTLREPRGGAVAVQNGDGNVIVFGGESPQGNDRGPLATAEIFADPLTPPGVAE